MSSIFYPLDHPNISTLHIKRPSLSPFPLPSLSSLSPSCSSPSPHFPPRSPLPPFPHFPPRSPLLPFPSFPPLSTDETVRISRQPRSPFFGYTVTIRLPGTAAEVGAWLNKKIIFYSVCSASSAVGFALGTSFTLLQFTLHHFTSH